MKQFCAGNCPEAPGIDLCLYGRSQNNSNFHLNPLNNLTPPNPSSTISPCLTTNRGSQTMMPQSATNPVHSHPQGLFTPLTPQILRFPQNKKNARRTQQLIENKDPSLFLNPRTQGKHPLTQAEPTRTCAPNPKHTKFRNEPTDIPDFDLRHAGQLAPTIKKCRNEPPELIENNQSSSPDPQLNPGFSTLPVMNRPAAGLGL